ncbi:unnamed protein product [Caenorhabditis auriculariae]|uniref:CRAL-TRIO domain-containing protein n=1 Tax=Caenorhabditis auriculariae TaxID=2777116 RepID=A0A8S1HVD1_9PELO|nr:unnamed protein product [Caenorhabditis auriculariae]
MTQISAGLFPYSSFSLQSKDSLDLCLFRMPISESDQEAIKKLRELVKDQLTPYYDTDFNLLRWLKGHDYNYDVIKPKLLNHLLFRKSDWDLDHLADKPRDHPVHNHWKSGLTGVAEKTPNTIVNIEQTGANDYWGMLNSYPINEILRARVHDLESMLRAVMELEARTGEQCSVIYVMDLTGLKMDRKLTTLVSGGLASISAFMAEHYVEMVHSFVLVNVPSFIHAVWTIARPLLPEKTRNKVNIMGSNWKADILKLAHGDCLPTYWNEEGNREPFHAPIERCVPFPTEGYYKGTVPSDSKILSVGPGKTDYVDVDVKEGQKLSWEIHANGHFAFVIYKVEDGVENENLARVYPLFSKIPGPTLVPCVDNLICRHNGKYRLWFGNQHAWFHTLKINYSLKIE